MDSWYGPPLAERLPNTETADDRLARRPLRTAPRADLVRALGLVLSTRRSDVLVTPNAGARNLIALTGLLARRNLVLLEYIVHRPSEGGLAGLVHRAVFFALRRILLPRALLAAFVLTEAEVDGYATLHHIDARRFRYVPWPGRIDRNRPLPPRSAADRRVLCSGRRCDWATFAAAAAGADWETTVVCSDDDADEVRALLAPLGALVLVEIDQEEHAELVRKASVYVVAVPETGASIGQIRVMNAADAGTPLVVSRVAGIESYVDETCAVLVPPGDGPALRSAVDALLADPDRQDRLRRNLYSRGADRDMRDYLDELAQLVRRTTADRDPAGRHFP